MISFLKNLKSNKLNRGMSYIELIVVLSIFAVISTVAIFNFGDFQSKVDIKNLASDIALKIVEAQKSALSGMLPLRTYSSTWKPSYGVYFNTSTNNKIFTYFTDLDAGSDYDSSTCPGGGSADECIEQSTITKGNYISSLDVFYVGGTTAPINDLTVVFARPSSGAVIKSSGIAVPPVPAVSYVQIKISSPKTTISTIKVYPSGRIQIN